MGVLPYIHPVWQFFTDEQKIVNLIGYASIVSAAIFGLFGLFTEYKKDGRITVWGRIAAGGIALSAVFAMSSSVLGERISAQKAEVDRLAAKEKSEADRLAANRERYRQQSEFRTQLRNFAGLNSKLESSLDSARRNISLTTALGAQERENSRRVMRGLWDEANRITPGSFEVEVDYLCRSLDGTRPPQVMPEGSVAEIGISTGTVAQAQRARFYAFATRRLIPTAIYLESVDQRISVIREDSDAYFTNWRQVSQFSAFVARGGDAGKASVDLGRFADPREWRDAAVEVIVRSAQPGIADRMFASFGWDKKNDFGMKLFSAEATSMYELPPEMVRNQDGWRALPCNVSMNVRVNHRIVATGNAAVIQMRDGPDDGAGVVVVKFPVVMAVPDALPQYSDVRRPFAAR